MYRSIRYRKGFGVHSPFVFNLITKVIEEKCSYYSFYDIELLRKQLLFKEGEITYPDRQNKGKRKTRSISEIVKRESIRPKHGALLFRLANYFKSKNILQIGTTMGLSTLYLTSYATGLRCIALENVPEFATIARQAFAKEGRNPIDLRIGNYKDLLPQALNDINSLDFVFFNTLTQKNCRNRKIFSIDGEKNGKIGEKYRFCETDLPFLRPLFRRKKSGISKTNRSSNS